jgi:hypothetical protein
LFFDIVEPMKTFAQSARAGEYVYYITGMDRAEIGALPSLFNSRASTDDTKTVALSCEKVLRNPCLGIKLILEVL